MQGSRSAAGTTRIKSRMDSSAKPVNVLVVAHYHSGKILLKELFNQDVSPENAKILEFSYSSDPTAAVQSPVRDVKLPDTQAQAVSTPTEYATTPSVSTQTSPPPSATPLKQHYQNLTKQ